MSENRTVAVLGPIPHDHITTYRGETFDKYGCVIYTVAALSTLLRPEDRVLPIVHVRRRDEEPIKELLAPFPNVDVTGIRSTSDRGDLVELSYVDQNKRIERQTGFMAPILPEDVEFALDADAFVCVPITDYQVSQATLSFIRQHSHGLILLDAHGPTISLTRGGARFHRLWIDRDSWLPNVDILKMNVEEAGCSWFPAPGASDEREIGDPLPTSELPRFAEHCLRHGVQAVCVTLDEQGCVVYFPDASGEMQEHVVGRVPVDEVVDTTGCGDSFAAGMAFGFLEYHDFVAACRYGNAMGAQRCAGSELRIYLPLSETNRQISSAYGDVIPHV
jgi:hypothetical protein